MPSRRALEARARRHRGRFGRALATLSLCCAGAVALACGVGATSDNNPSVNGGTLAARSLVVDPRTETTFLLDRFAGPTAEPTIAAGAAPVLHCDAGGASAVDAERATEPDAGTWHETVFAVDPAGTSARSVASYADGKVLQAMFPPSGVLFAVSDSATTELQLRDEQSGELLVRQLMPGTPDFLEISPDGRMLAGVLSAQLHGEVDRTVTLTDTETLATVAASCSVGRPVTRWLHDGNRLAVLVGDETRTERVRVWAMDAVRAAGFPTAADGLWSDPQVDITLPTTAATVSTTLGPSLTWAAVNSAAVSPDDRFLAFDANVGAGTAADPQVDAVVVVDLANGTSMANRGVHGPVAFTPDGSMLVGWDLVAADGDAGAPDGGDAGMRARLVLIDPTGITAPAFVPIPFEGAPQYFVTREGHQVLATAGAGLSGALVLVDLATGSVSNVPTQPGLEPLGTAVSRVGHDEVWLLDVAGLERIDLRTGSTDYFDPGVTPTSLGILPMHDLLVVSGANESGQRTLVFWDPNTLAVSASAPYGE